MALAKRILAFQMTTGEVLYELPPSALTWSTRLNKYGTIDATVRIGSADVDAASVRAFTKPKKFGLALVEGNHIIEAGHIVSRPYSADGRSVTISAVGLWGYLEWVHVFSAGFNRGASRPQTDIHTINGTTLAGIARKLIRNGMDNPYERGHTVNIVTTDDGEKGDATRTYYGADLATLAGRLHQLTGVEGGPDQAFQPEFTDEHQTHIHWVHRAGTKANPLLMQVGEPRVLDLTVEHSEASGLEVDEDGTAIATRIWTLGAMTENGEQGVATAANALLLSDGYPLLEADQSFDVEGSDVLISHTVQAVSDSSATLSTWTVNLNLDAVGSIAAGDFVHVITKGYGSVGDGTHLCRVVGVDGDHTGAVKLSIQPTLTSWEGFDPHKVPRRYIEPNPDRADLQDGPSIAAVGAGSGGSDFKLGTVTGMYNHDDYGYSGITVTPEGSDTAIPMDRLTTYQAATIGDIVTYTSIRGNEFPVAFGKIMHIPLQDTTRWLPYKPAIYGPPEALYIIETGWVILQGAFELNRHGDQDWKQPFMQLPAGLRPTKDIEAMLCFDVDYYSVNNPLPIKIGVDGTVRISNDYAGYSSGMVWDRAAIHLSSVAFNISPVTPLNTVGLAADGLGLVFGSGPFTRGEGRYTNPPTIPPELDTNVFSGWRQIPAGMRPSEQSESSSWNAMMKALPSGYLQMTPNLEVPAYSLQGSRWQGNDGPPLEWVDLTLLNGWKAVPGKRQLQAAVRSDGLVILRGEAKGNSGSVTKLPARYSPAFSMKALVRYGAYGESQYAGASTFIIEANGNITTSASTINLGWHLHRAAAR